VGHTYSLQSSLSMQRGKHLFKTGGEVRLLRGNYLTNNNPSGNFSFSQGTSGDPRGHAFVVHGFAMASFMLGYEPDSSTTKPVFPSRTFTTAFTSRTTTGHSEADLEPGYPLRIRNATHRALRPHHPRIRIRRHQPAQGARHGASRRPALRRRRRQRSRIYNPDRNNFAPV